jgi:hypothetical protein
MEGENSLCFKLSFGRKKIDAALKGVKELPDKTSEI